MTDIGVVIPARNEESAIEQVLSEIPHHLRARVIVVDNASSDRTAERARNAGAQVVTEARRGYGRAVRTGAAALEDTAVDILVVLDGDHSDYPDLMVELVRPIRNGSHDMVLSTRLNPVINKGSLPVHVVYGNKLVVWCMNRLFGTGYTDMGPFRAIRFESYRAMQMQDADFGWNVEMQVKASLLGLRVTEVSVPYRKRLGVSKISGTLSGSVRAGAKMFYTLARLYLGARLTPRA